MIRCSESLAFARTHRGNRAEELAFYAILVQFESCIHGSFVKEAVDVFAPILLRRAELAQPRLIVDPSVPFEPVAHSAQPQEPHEQYANPYSPQHAEKRA